MYKLTFVAFVAVGLGLHAAAYADTTVPVFAASAHAYGTLSYGQTNPDSSRQSIGCAVYPNATRDTSTIECKAHSAGGGDFWCYLVNPNPAMLSAVTSVNQNKFSFLQVGSDSQNHCTYVTATALSESPDQVKQGRDALQAIDASIARGQWGIKEYLGFYEKLGALSPPQAEVAMQKLASAIKSGSMEDIVLVTK